MSDKPQQLPISKLISEPLCDGTGPCTAAMHDNAELHTDGLLSLILDPDLSTTLTPGAILAADNRALFQLLPLILSAVQRIGATAANRQSFVRLVSVLRKRIVACRGLKLRFLLLIQNSAYAVHWVARMVHRRHCYATARHVLMALESDDSARNESNESVAVAINLFHAESSRNKGGPISEFNTQDLVAFAAQKLLHPLYGIRARTIVYHVRPVRSAFYGSELVEAIMELGNIAERNEALSVAQRLIDVGIITKVGPASRRFTDDRRRIYQCSFALQRDDDGHCLVSTADGQQLTSWHAVEEATADQIKQIAVQVPMDMVDLQSLEFWTNSVYVTAVEKGFRYGYRAIAHPLFCDGINAQDRLDYSAVKEQLQRSEDDELESTPSRSTSILASEEIYDMQQEGAVIGSVIVRKVFTSIARPMIVQLRVPIENADLDEDDHHLVLPPGLLIKEGDNLMQDLGVEIMFQCFNHIWIKSELLRLKYDNMMPKSLSYEVFPTSTTQGFMEAVTGLQSLREYDWKAWRQKFGDDKQRVREMLRSTAGAYIGTYVVGGRDRHFDNVLVKDDTHLMHIDFGFLMGTSPPIDGPPIAIAPAMEKEFRYLKVWDQFVELFVDTFMALRAEAPAIVRTAVLIFSKAGYEEHQIRYYLQGKTSLNVHETEEKVKNNIRRQLIMSSGDIKTKFKQFAHEHIDPAWYGLLEKGFPPAVAIMKIVDAKEQRATKKLASTRNNQPEISEEERLQVRE